MAATPPSTRRPLSDWLPQSRGWWLVAGAFAAGLLLFLVVWLGKRDEFDFYRAEGGATTDATGQAFEPLPVPLPAGNTPASGMDDSPAPPSTAHIEPPPATASPAPGQPASTSPSPDAGTPGNAVSAGDPSQPRLVHAPAPSYPRSALRAGVSGEVRLRIDVGADGVPAALEVITSSRNRDLDRAALQAVRQWRFQPAVRDGVPVAASVQQSVRFDAPN